MSLAINDALVYDRIGDDEQCMINIARPVEISETTTVFLIRELGHV